MSLASLVRLIPVQIRFDKAMRASPDDTSRPSRTAVHVPGNDTPQLPVTPHAPYRAPRRYRLITTLLDPATAPAGQIARIYAERWESETGYADLKTYLRGRQQILRSKDPDGVAQEVYALLIVYQLVQLARIRAAVARPGQEPLDPDRISFTVVLRALTRSIGEPSSRWLFCEVLDEIWGQPLLTRRPRSKPRERKGTAAFAGVSSSRARTVLLQSGL
jgi:hypothetical protein